MATSIPSCWIYFVFMSEQILNSILAVFTYHYITYTRYSIENICPTTKSSSYIFHITGSVATFENGMYIPLNGTVCVNLVYFIKLAYIRFVNAKLLSSSLFPSLYNLYCFLYFPLFHVSLYPSWLRCCCVALVSRRDPF